VPEGSITAWSDLRGEHAEPLSLFEIQYLPRQEINKKLEKIVRYCNSG